MNKKILLVALLSASLSSYADDGWKAFFEDVQMDKVAPINQTLKLPLTDLNIVAILFLIAVSICSNLVSVL